MTSELTDGLRALAEHLDAVGADGATPYRAGMDFYPLTPEAWAEQCLQVGLTDGDVVATISPTVTAQRSFGPVLLSVHIAADKLTRAPTPPPLVPRIGRGGGFSNAMAVIDECDGGSLRAARETW